MMQPSAGSQPNPQQQVQPDLGKIFLDNYSNYIADTIAKLKSARIPDSFGQVANGQVSQDLTAHKEDYV